MNSTRDLQAEISSGVAIQKCMDAIGFNDRTRQSYEIIAQFRYANSQQRLGNISVTFMKRNHSDFPEIDCGTEIRGWNVPYDNFCASFQKMDFINNEGQSEVGLRISDSNKYDFILCFRTKN